MDKRKLLDHAAPEERVTLARVLDRAEQAENRNAPTSTDFLSPQQQVLARDLLHQAGIPEERCLAWGGYEGAERRVLLFLPEWMDPADGTAQSPICCLRAEFREEFRLTHRDFLGSLMGLGIVREKVGDLLVSAGHCDLLVLESVAPFLLQNWESAGRAKVTVTELPPETLEVPEAKTEELRDTVSSLRLDAIVAAGFRMARGKAAALIESGKVQVNWRDCLKTDKPLEPGDVISARGFGKLELAEVGGLTRKGRISVTVKRYL